jgi:hypothetical protein
LILAQKLVLCCFNFVKLLHYFSISLIILVPKSIVTNTGKNALTEEDLRQIREGLAFRYSHLAATNAPSKQTATQRKGRVKDEEAAEDTQTPPKSWRSWRKPSFISGQATAVDAGNAVHAFMQYLATKPAKGESVSAKSWIVWLPSSIFLKNRRR